MGRRRARGAGRGPVSVVVDDELEGVPTGRMLAASGVSMRQLHYWATICGVIAPAHPPDVRGSGAHRRWAVHQVAHVRILGALTAMGATVDRLRIAMADLEADSSLLRAEWLYVDEQVGHVHLGPVLGWAIPRSVWHDQ
jgi:DNA-binding transcriptional MerR regulator